MIKPYKDKFNDLVKAIRDNIEHIDNIPMVRLQYIEEEMLDTGNCPKCGNPKTMYWCQLCEENSETPHCSQCKRTIPSDNHYHDNCS